MRKLKDVLCVGLAVSLAIATQAASAKDMVISIWDGYMAPDALDKFKAASGVDVDKALHATNEEIMGKLMASGGEGYDVVFVSSPFAEVLHKQGLLADIDPVKVPNLKTSTPKPLTWNTTPATTSRCLTPGARRVSAIAPTR
jgi:spermidine/putrescine transport system substrate-binding protein